jgi:hypothetical protein
VECALLRSPKRRGVSDEQLLTYLRILKREAGFLRRISPPLNHVDAEKHVLSLGLNFLVAGEPDYYRGCLC